MTAPVPDHASLSMDEVLRKLRVPANPLRIVCQARGRKHGVTSHNRARMKFKCPRCELWICGHCEGTTGEDPELDRLCDPCWCVVVEERERKRALRPVALESI